MRFILIVFTFLFIGAVSAQDVRYSISVPNGGRMGYEKLPDSIDTSHYYTHREIRYLAEPADGWSSFYDRLKTLEYPQQAKNKKLQSGITVGYQVNELGILDSVYILRVDIGGKWKKCLICEELILDFFRNFNWKAGTLLEESVKTVDYVNIEFRIYDPNANKESNSGPFGD